MFQVRVIGTSAAIPTTSRLPSAQVVTINDRHHLVDCGEGTQMQLIKQKVKFSRLDAIFISHLHGDHLLGLPGLLTTLSLYERTDPLYLYGPAGLRQLLDNFFEITHSYLKYPLELIPTEDFEPGQVIYSRDRYEVRLLPLVHRIYCRGFRFLEVNKPPKFDFYKAKALEVPNQYFRLLKQGNVITLEDGREVHPDQVLEDPEPPFSFSYCSDTAYTEPLVEHVRDSHLLYHEATFLQHLQARAKETYHSTAKEAATIANLAQAKQLILGHYSARYRDLTPFLDEARSIFPNTHLAREGYVYDLKQLEEIGGE